MKALLSGVLSGVLGVLFVAGVWVFPPAWVNAAQVTIPSATAPGGEILISGTDFFPFTAALVTVEQADGAKSEQYVEIGAEGILTYSYLPVVSGPHTVAVFDPKGAKIGGGTFISQ